MTRSAPAGATPGRWGAAASLLVCLALLGASCAASGGGQGSDGDELRQARQFVEEALAGSSPEAVAALGDGFVTRAELEAGAARFRSCVSEAGAGELAVTFDETTAELGYDLDTGTSDAEVAEQRLAAFDACHQREMLALEAQWDLQHAMSPDQKRRLGEAMVACLQAGGETVTDWPGGEVTDAALESRCYDEAVAGLGSAG
ncbi:MAG: hypothetical protein D6683_17680 [Actinomyces sp.]|nr:MAG: hypothetical protein D6683_17680 [Actinomyces sp.]